MDQIALLIAATLASGTPLAIAGLGLLINEKSGVLNLGAEGIMLVAAIAGFAAAHASGSDTLAFAAGAAAGAVLAAAFGVLVIWLNTNQYATGLALSLFGVGFSAFAGIKYVQEKLPERPQFALPLLGDIPWVGEAFTNRADSTYKTELVIMLKPQVIEGDTWQRELQRSSELLDKWYPEGR